MSSFKDTKDAIMYANEHLVTGDFFNNIILTAKPITDYSITDYPLNDAFFSDNLGNNLGGHIGSHIDKHVDIVEYLYHWSLTPLSYNSNLGNNTGTGLDTVTDTGQSSRLFYLFGDFGSGKSGICKQLVSKLHEHYEASRYGDTMAKPVLPLYFNLRLLTGIYDELEFANKSLAELIEVMFCVAGIPKVAGEDIIKLVRQYPCVVVFDGFDEAVQKLGKNQQNGFLNKLLSLLPSVQYTKDLMRIIGQPVEESTIPDSPSRIVISCRSQLFESKQEQTTFTEAFYNTELSINGIHNYQAYQIDKLATATVKKNLQRYIYTMNKTLPIYQQLDLTHEDSNTFVEYLLDLSINPLLLSLSKSLLPNVKPSLDKTGFINSAEMFTDLMSKLMQRDSGKGIINIKEKQKIFGKIALTMWQQCFQTGSQTGSQKVFQNGLQKDSKQYDEQSSQQPIPCISLENLRQFFFDHYKCYRQLQLGIDTGRVELEIALQDLHSSMIVRDNNDMYTFYHPLIFDYFLAVGIFETVMQSVTVNKMDSSNLLDSLLSNSFAVKGSAKNSNIDKLAIINSLNADSLIFISQMLMSLIIRHDMHSYNHFYRQWLTLCEQVAGLDSEDSDDKGLASESLVSENNAQARDKAVEMWKIVMGEEVPEDSVLYQ